MSKKFLTRLLFLAMISLLGYFAIISTDQATIPIEKSDRQAIDMPKELIRGENVQYKSFDSDGNEIVSGSSAQVIQQGDRDLKLQEGLELKFTADGKKYSVKADSYGTDELGREVMMANQGGKIILQVEDMTIQTSGPLIHNKDGSFSTSEVANFHMGNAQGQSRGLRYKPYHFLELIASCEFVAETDDGRVDMKADYIHFDILEHRGVFRNGTIVSLANEEPVQETRLEAQEMLFLYRGGSGGEPFEMSQASLSGQPAHFLWQGGELLSPTFDVCFDVSGRWIDELTTGYESFFSAQAQDGYTMVGKTGQLTLLMEASVPLSLLGSMPIELEGKQELQPSIYLRGDRGVETRFEAGKAYSTHIFGSPEFQYGKQSGRSGNLRISHNERNIIFSEGSELHDGVQNTRITADEILLSDWDQEEKEVNAFKFVEISYFEGTPNVTQAFCEDLKLRMPMHHIRMKGSPVKINRKGMDIQAGELLVNQIDEDIFNIEASRDEKGEVILLMITDEGPAEVRSRTLSYEGDANKLSFTHVSQAKLPERGTLSAKLLEVNLKDKGDKKVVERIKATNEVLFTGKVMDKGEETTVNCTADQLDYQRETEVLVFLGKNKDVVFQHPRGVFRGRELTYNLKDGSIRGDSARHGTTKTTINLNTEDDNDN